MSSRNVKRTTLLHALAFVCAVSCATEARDTESRRSTLRIHLRDAKTGLPVTGRVGLYRDGNSVEIEGRSGFTGWSTRRQPWLDGGGEISWTLLADSELATAPGSLRLVANRGLEYVPEELQIELEPGQARDVEVRLERWIDLRRMGWHSADFHLHIARFSTHHDTALRRLMESEGLDAAALVDWSGRAAGDERSPHWGGWEWRREELAAPTSPSTPILFLAQHWAMADRACELGFFGHNTPVEGRSKFSRASMVKSVVGEGGLAIGAMGNVFIEGALLGKVLAVEILSTGRFRGLDEWYRLLNVGCRIAAVAGTDAQSSAKPQTIVDYHGPPGANRFYVHLGHERGDERRFLDGISKGRTFVTTGPVVLLTVNGMRPGEEVRLSGADQVAVTLMVSSALPPAGRLAIIRNGVVVWSEELDPRTGTVAREIEIDIDQSSWVVARFIGVDRVPGAEMPMAHTSPVYVTIADRPIFDEIAAQTLLEELPSRETTIGSGFSTKAERSLALEWVEAARAKLERRR